MDSDGSSNVSQGSGFLWPFLGLVVAAGLLAALLLPAIQTGRPISMQSSCVNNLKQFGIALNNYHDTFKCFPPAYIADADGKPMHSWRVLLLPYFEEAGLSGLYKQYDFNEPWNGPHNNQLTSKMPAFFRCPSDESDTSMTSYVAVVGPETAWPETRAEKARDIRDGMSNTIMVVEASHAGINWLEPRDVAFEQALQGINKHDAPSGIASDHGGGANFLFADGSVHFLQDTIPPETLRSLLTAAGNDLVPIPD